MKYLRRGIWYVAGRLLVICLVLGLMITVFYYTMNLSNIQIDEGQHMNQNRFGRLNQRCAISLWVNGVQMLITAMTPNKMNTSGRAR